MIQKQIQTKKQNDNNNIKIERKTKKTKYVNDKILGADGDADGYGDGGGAVAGDEPHIDSVKLERLTK